MSASAVTIREITEADLVICYAHRKDPVASRLAAFTPAEPGTLDAFIERWRGILSDDTVVARAVEVDGEVAGQVVSFLRDGEREVAYWIGREFWGRGVATRALEALLVVVAERPLSARAAVDNAASIRVLEKCGFRHVGRETTFAEARGSDVEEVVMVLD